MGAKRAVNRALRTVGVQVIRTDTLAAKDSERTELSRRVRTLEQQVTALDARTDAAEKRARSATKQLKAEQAKQAKAREAALLRRDKLPADYHPDMQRIWPAVKDRTMVGKEKLNHFCDAARYVSTAGLDGAIVECGVWRGGAMLGCAMVLDSLGDHTRDLYLYDTYAGMSAATDRDVHLWHGRTADEELATKATSAAPIWEPGPLEDVKAAFDQVAYPKEKLHFVVGKVEDTIPQTVPESISILRLDTDWYESTKHELTHLYHRLVPGGVLIIDDYGSWQGSRDATDEFLAAIGEPLMLTRISRGRAAIKPGPITFRGPAAQGSDLHATTGA